MAIAPINVARVSQNLMAARLLNTVRASQLGLFQSQNQLATGLRFQTLSEDPARGEAALTLDARLDRLNTVATNVRSANAVLASAEAAMQQAMDLVNEAHNLALQAASDSTTPDERRALAVAVDALITETVAIANSRYLDASLFSGLQGPESPFERLNEGVLFRGDGGRREALLDTDLSQDFFTISGSEFFRAVSSGVRGAVDLDPALTLDTRLSDLEGANGVGVKLGAIVITEGAGTAQIDLTQAATVGDVIDRLNAEMPGNLVASINTKSIRIQSADNAPVQITVQDVAGGRTAADLGLLAESPVQTVSGADLNARLTPRTHLSTLLDGEGVDLSAGFTVQNGNASVRFDLSSAQTLEDVLNALNHSDARVTARIADDGRRIEVLNRLSGSALSIGENGGQAATVLGIRSLYSGTRLGELNDGRGVTTVSGDDFRITTADGTVIDIDLDAIDTANGSIQDVIDLINEQAAGAVTASLNASSNGLTITDNTAGAQTLRIERLNVSPAIDWLGLDVGASGNRLVGRDVNRIKVDGPFTGMYELHEAMQNDDVRGAGYAAERLNRVLSGMRDVQGRLSAKAGEMLRRADSVETETAATEILRSDVRDADFAETVVRFQQVQTALQANLATAGRTFSLSLLDFLR